MSMKMNMIYVVMLAVLVGCSTESDKTVPDPEPMENGSAEVDTQASTSDKVVPPEEEFCFPRQTVYYAESDGALFSGTLVERDGCLRGVSDDGSAGYLIVWPYGYTLDRSGVAPVVRDSSGTVVASVGTTVLIGGGETKGFAPNDKVEDIDCCEGPYWVAGRVEGARPEAVD